MSTASPKHNMAFAKECDSKSIHCIGLYKAKLATAIGKSRRPVRAYHFLFIALYLYQITWVVSTIGEPYRLFLEKADREGFQVMQGATKLRAELEHSFQDLNDPNRRTDKIGYLDWMDMDIEELAAEKKRDKERSVLDALPKSMRVPNQYSPAFWPSLLLGVLATLHALVLLMQHWSVAFNVWINYAHVNAVDVTEQEWMEIDEDAEEEWAQQQAATSTSNAASANNKEGTISRVPDRLVPHHRLPPHLPTHARLVPAKGKHVLVPVEYYPTIGMSIEYHRRRFAYDPDTEQWTKIRCRTDMQVAKLAHYAGISSPHRVIASQVRYGPNMFSVKQPTFAELYKKQILNPFSVFQIFCVLLWAIDDYLVYSFFSLFMVLMFEGTVVFQRLKSLQALRGMGNPSRLVYVHRSGEWVQIDTTELLPGDILSLTRHKPLAASANKDKKTALVADDGGDIVPADLLLLRGSTVVNEASLTGESVPQMKEGLSDLNDDETLDIKGAHKMNVAYAGTKMLQCKGVDEVAAFTNTNNDNTNPMDGIPLDPPDKGCVCFVLRTGFASAQGKLVRMIEGSQEKVQGHERETGLLLLLLCVFAIISSSYVLYHGMHDENRSKYELLLHCILIVTSVIRPELPMQMALAVNNSLMTLMKMHVFCTEPYRVPVAGKLDACLFDKTGTLTTDELVAVGVCEPKQLSKQQPDENDWLTPMAKIHRDAAFVLAGCHSLVVVDDETQGDPLESASLASMHWHVNAQGLSVPAPAKGKTPAGKPIVLSSSSSSEITQVEILTRHHFSSKLQRMSCVVKAGGRAYSVAKGSPEAIGRLLANKSADYDRKSEYFAKQGYRVIALAMKPLNNVANATESRAACESDLEFCGFIAFTCMVRKDTASVLLRLKQGGMSVTMVTGDALLTAIHVAKEVEICEPLEGGRSASDEDAQESNEELKSFLASKGRKIEENKSKKLQKSYRRIAYLDTSENGELYWRDYDEGGRVESYMAKEIPRLARDYDLATSGKCLNLAFEQDEGTKDVLQYVKVFARMTPDAKEKVIECLHSVGALCLMCGDGANDVGALKQADVGVALLSGFGNLNVEKAEEEKEPEKETKGDDGVRAIMSKEHLDQVRALPVRLLKMKIRTLGVDPDKYPEITEKDDLVQLYQIKAREVAVKRHDQKLEASKKNMTVAEKRAKQKEEMVEKQRKLQIRTEELQAQGVSFASFKAMKEMMNEEMLAAKKKKGEMSKARGIEGSAATLAAQLDEIDTVDVPVVKLGDASIAAPFTSKMPSIKSCVDIVRQGRCTLVSSIQMYQIMALQCLISSYSLSVLYLDGVKYGDSQMTAMGLLGSVSFMSVSRSKPLDKLSSVRPLNSIFHPALFCSLLGQFAVHLFTMVFAVQTAKKHLPPDYEADLDGQFQPGILNTVVFLISSVQQVTVFFVNLQGRPFMTGVTENRPLLWSLASTFILTFMFASETVPGLNRYFQLVPFPDESFRTFILTILGLDLLATFVLDRAMKFIFCREILAAGWENTSMSDVFSFVKTFGIIGFLMYSFMGNSEQWDILLEMEQNMTMNMTEGIDGLAEGAEQCVGAACEAVQATAEAMRDEF